MFYLLIVLYQLFSFTAAQPSTPSRPFGYVLGNDSAPIHLDAYFDFMCPFSAAAYPTMKALMSHYGPQTLKFTLYNYFLPYHHNAYFAAQTGAVVYTLGKDFWKFVDIIFANQATWFNQVSLNMTGNSVISGMASLAVQCGVDMNDFMNQFYIVDINLRASYSSMASRGIYGSPLFYINGAFQWQDSTTTLQQWQTIIDNLIQSQYSNSLLKI